ncbi:MAG: methyltransferase domain-containing protein [Planctomycetota bacterium]
MAEERMAGSDAQAVRGRMSELYDVFVDWEGRLAREVPGIRAHLERSGARRVLDVGCGTGRHVQALLAAGYDAHGADASEEMLAQARALVGAERFHAWRLGDEPPADLAAGPPFDAVICMGNTWPLVYTEEDARAAARALRRIVRPGGLVLVGLKALGVRRESGNPYLPLLKRQKDGRPLWFVRFVDFAVPPLADGTIVGDLHVVVAAGDGREGGESEAVLHRTARTRVWMPEELGRWFAAAGFVEVRASGRLDDPGAPPAGEDVFVSARVPPATP